MAGWLYPQGWLLNAQDKDDNTVPGTMAQYIGIMQGTLTKHYHYVCRLDIHKQILSNHSQQINRKNRIFARELVIWPIFSYVLKFCYLLVDY